MHLSFSTEAEETEFDYAGFNACLRRSGIYVDTNSMTGDIEGGGVMYKIYGDEEAIKYYYSLWYDGYRGEKINDPKLDGYIERGRVREKQMLVGNTGIQG